MHSHTKQGLDAHRYAPKWYLVLLIFCISLLLIFPFQNQAPDPSDINHTLLTGKVLKVVSEETSADGTFGAATPIQKLRVEVDQSGNKKVVEISNTFAPAKEGELIVLQPSFGDDFIMTDFIRTRGILWLVLFFVLLVYLVSGKKGMYALVALLFSFAIVLSFILPFIRNGLNPVLISLIGAFFILLVTLYVSYGFNKKSIAALLGILGTLFFVSLLANFTVYALHFTGFSTEEAGFLKLELSNSINIVGLVTAGIIIAAIGVLDDIAVTQAAVVFELAETDKSLGRWELFRKAMGIGKDHISAVINTLVLAYTGASLPLVLLFTLRTWPLEYTISNELIAEEIVRTLISSAGLVMAVPLTTFIAATLAVRQQHRRMVTTGYLDSQ